MLSALVELEVPDAVDVESRSGLELLERDLPIFAGLRSLVPSGIGFSSPVICLIENDRLAEEALAVIRDLSGTTTDDAGGPRNSAMLVPVSDVELFWEVKSKELRVKPGIARQRRSCLPMLVGRPVRSLPLIWWVTGGCGVSWRVLASGRTRHEVRPVFGAGGPQLGCPLDG